MNALVNWYAQLESRERVFVAAGGVLAVLLLFYGLVWAPIHGNAQRLERQVATKRVELARVEQLTAQLGPSGTAPASGTTLLVVIDRAIQRAALSAYAGATSVQQDKSVRVSFENAPFNDIVKLLGQLKSAKTVLIKYADFDEGDEAGTVNASLSLTRAAG